MTSICVHVYTFYYTGMHTLSVLMFKKISATEKVCPSLFNGKYRLCLILQSYLNPDRPSSAANSASRGQLFSLKWYRSAFSLAAKSEMRSSLSCLRIDIMLEPAGDFPSLAQHKDWKQHTALILTLTEGSTIPHAQLFWI